MELIFCALAFLILLAGYGWITFRVLLPIRRLSRQAEQMAHGDFSALQQPCGGIQEVDSLRRSMVAMVGHVRRAQEQSRIYSDAVTDGQEVERARIAAELHDDTVQSLIAISQTLSMAKAFIAKDAVRAETMLQTARQQTVDTADNLRDLIGNLRPPALEELGLLPAVQMQIEKVKSAQVNLTIEGIQRRLKPTHEIALFRIIQEALTNIGRHSQAQHVEIRIDFQPHGIQLRVHDDGKGFQVPPTLDDLAAQGHYGLMGIQERVQRLNGTFTICSNGKSRGAFETRPSIGTTLEIFIPIEADLQPAHTVRDPVCSTVIEPNQAYGSIEYAGKRYYFCCPVCQGSFQRSPELYLSQN